MPFDIRDNKRAGFHRGLSFHEFHQAKRTKDFAYWLIIEKIESLTFGLGFRSFGGFFFLVFFSAFGCLTDFLRSFFILFGTILVPIGTIVGLFILIPLPLWLWFNSIELWLGMLIVDEWWWCSMWLLSVLFMKLWCWWFKWCWLTIEATFPNKFEPFLRLNKSLPLIMLLPDSFFIDSEYLRMCWMEMGSEAESKCEE